MSWWQSLKAIFTDTETPKQKQFIESYQWSNGVRARFATQHSQLTNEQQNEVWEALRDYFAICHQAKGATVPMPSRVVDDSWHTFLLFTREYSEFCQQAFGRYLHHTPHEGNQTSAQSSSTKGISRLWVLACKREGLNPNTTDRLPRLFAIDAKLGIANGFTHDVYVLRRYVGSGSGCSSGGCSGSSSRNSNSHNSNASNDGDSGGDSSCSASSCGGSSCGGGCGGD